MLWKVTWTVLHTYESPRQCTLVQQSSQVRSRVVWWISTNVSKRPDAYIVRAEKYRIVPNMEATASSTRPTLIYKTK